MTNTAPAPADQALIGTRDVRSTPLAVLAETARAGESLRHVLPGDTSGRVTVAAFGSSI